MTTEDLKQPLRPTQYAEYRLITSILNQTFPCGSKLPGERELAEKLGVTRPTLRETLQRLAQEKWITIQHGKATTVNDYWNEGGLGMLGTMARYADFLPEGFITNLLEVRLNILPGCAQSTCKLAPHVLVEHLALDHKLGNDPAGFAEFDWVLQELMVRNSGNRIYPLILNDFAGMYRRLAIGYFSLPIARKTSKAYYRDLRKDIAQGGRRVSKIVENVMKTSIEIWMEVKSMQTGN